MATTVGYSSRNSRSNGSGARPLMALSGARITVGRQASALSIHPVRTAGLPNVTDATDSTIRCQSPVAKSVYNDIRMGESALVGWRLGVLGVVTRGSAGRDAG